MFGLGAIVGWPFSILASFPFVFEELFVYSGDKVADTTAGQWLAERWIRMLGAVVLTSFLFVCAHICGRDVLLIILFHTDPCYRNR